LTVRQTPVCVSRNAPSTGDTNGTDNKITQLEHPTPEPFDHLPGISCRAPSRRRRATADHAGRSTDIVDDLQDYAVSICAPGFNFDCDIPDRPGQVLDDAAISAHDEPLLNCGQNG
jgi:hypothetical protein